MANLGLSNSSVQGLAETAERRRSAISSGISTRRKWETALHVVLFVAAFVFVAAIVCGIGI
jgi:hypothetical protein